MEYVIAEDHASIRIMVRQILESRLGVEADQIREVKNGDGLLLSIYQDPERDRLIVMDLVMPGKYMRVALLRELLRRSPQARVVAYTGDESPLLAAAILQHGGLGFVTKASPVTHLVEAVRAAQDRKQYVDDNIDVTAIWGHPWLKLSESERQVMVELCRGKKLAEIAAAQNRTYSTLRSQKSNAMRKLKVRDDIELMAFIQRHGLQYELDP